MHPDQTLARCAKWLEQFIAHSEFSLNWKGSSLQITVKPDPESPIELAMLVETLEDAEARVKELEEAIRVAGPALREIRRELLKNDEIAEDFSEPQAEGAEP